MVKGNVPGMLYEKPNSSTPDEHSLQPSRGPSAEKAHVPYPGPVAEGRFIRREKRFLVLVEMDGREVWIHSNNTGSMLGLMRPGARILASHSDNPRRRLAWTQEAVYSETAGCWVGVNTSTPNRMLVSAYLAGALDFAGGYDTLRTEAKRTMSRFDGLFESRDRPRLWVECKNVTLVEDEVAIFPDAASERGRKHLEELMDVTACGERAAMFYLVQRTDASCFGPAECVDPEYARLFWQAVERGVEIHALEAPTTPQGILLGRRLPLARPACGEI